MNNLLEFTTHIKGVEYLIAIAFLLAFIAFWQLAFGRRRGRWRRIAVPGYMAAGLLILAGSCAATGP